MFASFGFGGSRRLFADRDGAFDVLPFCWLPGETLSEREDEDNMPYRLWAQDGTC
jgi:hypothetical protein